MIEIEEIKKRLAEIVWCVEYRPGMVFSRNTYTYAELSAYINGVFHGIEFFSDVCIGPNFSYWINDNKKTPVVWDLLINKKAERLTVDPSHLLVKELKLFIENGNFSSFNI
ncbi:MAG: hypothetical protein ACOVRN_06490 [Flavobacterium sp.]